MSPHSWLIGHRSTLPHDMRSQVYMPYVESVITLSTLVPIVWSQVSGRKTSTITIIHVLTALACLVPTMRRSALSYHYTSRAYSFTRCLDIHVSVIRGIRYEAHETCRICTPIGYALWRNQNQYKDIPSLQTMSQWSVQFSHTNHSVRKTRAPQPASDLKTVYTYQRPAGLARTKQHVSVG